MGIRPTDLHLRDLLRALPRWFLQLPPLILGRHTCPKKGGSGVVCVIASELIPEQLNCVCTTRWKINSQFFFVRVIFLDITVVKKIFEVPKCLKKTVFLRLHNWSPLKPYY